MTYSSNQDFFTSLASITAPCQKGDLGSYLARYQRSMYNSDAITFQRYINKAMGYKTCTVNDWEA